VNRPPRWRARWNAFRYPIAEEKARVLKERWESLPLELRTNNQISGRHLTHCGFTLGASYCSFHCTHCYLPKNANEINFMDAKQVAQADTDPVVRARLDSCVFKGAVKRKGEWVAVPMCSMNQQTWWDI
jgi:hypothetical protein